LTVELSPISYLEHIVDKCNLLWGGCSDSGISSLQSTGDGMGRDGGSGGNAAVTASMRVWVDAILSVWIWVRHTQMMVVKVVNEQVEPCT
ncbi:hypothetical protein Tco_0512662, partial [Tanacetum coccineum]